MASPPQVVEEEVKVEVDVPVPLAAGVAPLPKHALLARELGLRRGRGLNLSATRPKETSEPRAEAEVAEERLIARPEFAVTACKLGGNGSGNANDNNVMFPSSTRSTFLMVFSPDKRFIASTHGDHNVYLSRVKDGVCERVLRGHPRTPWCVAFHPSRPDVLASGCLAGQVRVWDLRSGASEKWMPGGVIASLAFHPVDRILVVANMTEVHFWDWSRSVPFARASTRNEKEKVRYVKFDALGHQLITGIANLNQEQQHQQQQEAVAGGGSRRTSYAYYGQPPYGRDSSRSRHHARSTSENSDLRMRIRALTSYPARGPFATSEMDASNSTSTAQASSSTSSSLSSASQTLSDLAQAATNQLMAENAAAAASAAFDVPTRLQHASSLQQSRLQHERDDPFLSDHPYGLPPVARSWRSSGYEAALAELRGLEMNRRRGELEDDDAFLIDAARRTSENSAFRHSPASEFVQVGNTSTQVYNNPDRSPSSESQSRFRSNSERRLRDLLDRRSVLVSQIEHLRSARELLFPAEALSSPTPGSTAAGLDAADNSTNGIRPPTNSDHTYGARPIDEWAVTRRMSMESRRLADSLLTGDEEEPLMPSAIARIRERQQLLRRQQFLRTRSHQALLPPTRSASMPRRATTQINPAILNRTDVEAATETVVVPRDSNTDDNEANRSEETSPTTTNTASPSNEESTTQEESNNRNRQDLDVTLLSRHISHIQRICRESLSDVTTRRPRRHVVRLQTIRRILEDLQRQVRGLRDASQAELNRRTRQAESIGSALGAARSSSARASASLQRLRRFGTRMSQAKRGHASSGATSSRAHPAVAPTSASSSNRGRVSRVHNQFVSRWLATCRAIELGPDLSRKKNNPLSRLKAAASQAVMEQTEKTASVSASVASGGTRNELRAISQRLERMSRERREAQEALNEAEEAESVSPNSSPLDLPDPSQRRRRNSNHSLYVGVGAASSSESEPESPNDAVRQRQRHMAMVRQRLDATREHQRRSREHETLTRRLNASSALAASSSESENEQDPMIHRRRMAMIGRYHPPLTERLSRSTNSLRERMDRRLEANREYQRRYRERLGITNHSSDANSESDRQQHSSPQRDRSLPRLFAGSSANASPTSEDASQTASNSERLPPLRELIWRRLRRRNAQLNLIDDEISAAGNNSASNSTTSRDRSRPREMLSWMVDQMTIEAQEELQRQHWRSTRRRHNAQPGESASTSRPSYNDQQQPPPAPSSLAERRRYMQRWRHMDMQDVPVQPPPQFQRENIFLHNTTSNMLLTHRIQAWDISRIGSSDVISPDFPPDISDPTANIVVAEAKIHNDASVDIAEDGTILVTLVPANLPMTTVVGVYSLKPATRGQCFATFSLESSAVSVSLSPTTRHLLVGLATTRPMSRLSTAYSTNDRGLMAQVFRIKLPWDRRAERGRLIHRRDIPQAETLPTSLNCIRWVPVAGQGFVYATNTGLLKILR